MARLKRRLVERRERDCTKMTQLNQLEGVSGIAIYSNIHFIYVV